MKKIFILMCALCVLALGGCAAEGEALRLDEELCAIKAEWESPDFENKFTSVHEFCVCEIEPALYFRITPWPDFENRMLIYENAYLAEFYSDMYEWVYAEKELYYSEGVCIKAEKDDDPDYKISFFLTDNFTSLDGKEVRSAEFMGLDFEIGDSLTIYFSDKFTPFWVNSGYDFGYLYRETIIEDESGERAFVYVML